MLDQFLFCLFKVGFPNVGKSSTINALIGDKKTSVSSTPGKTKHFQVCVGNVLPFTELLGKLNDLPKNSSIDFRREQFCCGILLLQRIMISTC